MFFVWTPTHYWKKKFLRNLTKNVIFFQKPTKPILTGRKARKRRQIVIWSTSNGVFWPFLTFFTLFFLIFDQNLRSFGNFWQVLEAILTPLEALLAILSFRSLAARQIWKSLHRFSFKIRVYLCILDHLWWKYDP